MNIVEEKEEECKLVHELDVEVAYLNENQIMKPSSYQALFAQLAEKHLAIYSSGANVTMKHGLAWALISMSIEVVHPIDNCMKLHAYTWYSQRKGPYFRRELVFCNDKGDIMFQGSTFSILLDISTRGVFRKKELPFSLTIPHAEFCVDATPHFRRNYEYKPIETRKVYNSYIDSLGHVNNRHYGDFAFDALTDEEKIHMKDLKRMDYYFISEMRNNDKFTISKAAYENQIFLQGYNNTKGDISFDIVFNFA